MTRAKLVTLLLAVIAVAATLGHICVLPGHVHAAPEADAHNAAHDDHDDATPTTDGVHAASCDAIRPGTTIPSVAPVPAALALAPIFALPLNARARLASTEAPVPTGSPPLYITHRALLI